jgi:methionyl-tRNA formyltransferase
MSTDSPHDYREWRMRLDGVMLLAAPTARSQAYLQSLVANGLPPARVVAMGDGVQQSRSGESAAREWNGIRLPDLGESLAATCARAEIPFSTCSATNVNDAAVTAAIGACAANIVIYSGYGGQIVSDRVLESGSRFLHLHSGWLPEYRGSTTIYYALLQGENPGVTAIVLDRNIDTGPIVAKRHYPKPPAGLDIDSVYDAAIRADLLVRVMSAFATAQELPRLEPQLPDQGTTYYVIHPVLKHMAILSLGGGRP